MSEWDFDDCKKGRTLKGHPPPTNVKFILPTIYHLNFNLTKNKGYRGCVNDGIK